MQFESLQLGHLEFDPEKIVTFPQGLPAFEDCTRYKLFHQADQNEPNIYWLQSLDRAELTFNLADPARLGVRYELALTEDEAELLAADADTRLAALVMVYRDEAADAQAGNLRANLQAPLLINLERKLGLQKCGLACDLVFRG